MTRLYPCASAFLSPLNLKASSKSEGSPSQRLENVAKKPEEKKEVFRPLKPAVRNLRVKSVCGCLGEGTFSLQEEEEKETETPQCLMGKHVPSQAALVGVPEASHF